MDIREFKEFLLVEKIEKREFTKAFADDTIRIGIEFECYIDGLAQGFSEGREDAAKWYFDLQKDVESYVREYQDSKEEWQSEMQNRIDAAAKERQDDADALQVKLEAMDEDHDDYEDIKEKIEELENEVYEIEELSIWDLESDADNYDIEYIDEYEWVDGSISSFPYIDDDLVEYISEFTGERMSDIEEKIKQLIWNATYEESDFESDMQENGYAVYPDDGYGDSGGSTTLVDLEEWDWDRNFPFNNYIIGDYHDSQSFHQWRIELDPSTGDNGVEIISPIMKLQDALPVMKKMFDFISRYGGTTSEHGMHVNISKKGVGTDKVDLLKLMLFVDEGFVWKKFPDRVGNFYAGSVLKDIIAIVRNDMGAISKDVEAKRKAEKLHAASNIIFPSFKAKLNLPKEKYKGVNFSHLHAGDGRIEMRYLGGKDYHKKYKENVSAIGRYVYYLLLSLDEDFKKKEYVQKLLRLSSKYAGKEPDKIDKREFDKVIKNGDLVFSDSNSIYKKLGKFVYKIIEGKIVERYSLVSWKGIKAKMDKLNAISDDNKRLSEFQKVYKQGKTLGTFGSTTYMQLGRVVYEIQGSMIIRQHRLANWKKVKSKLKNFVAA